ncbi:MAG: SDR family NAD(P)-dependent oxidoreductase [Pseudomonadota bacterium]
MAQKSILITGCSSGIGYDAAKTLHDRGWRVFATCRQDKDCKRLRDEGMESFKLDLASPVSIKKGAAEALKRTGGTLDALFNNGAFATPGFVQDLPIEALRETFDVNFFGQFELIRALMPTFEAQGYGRIVNNSSVLGFAAMRARGAYNSSKFAMEGLTDTMRLELRGQPIDIILIEPGPITTDIRQNAQPKFEKWIDWKNSPRRKVYEHTLMPRLYDESGKLDPGELPPSAVTEKLILALKAKRPKPRYFVTRPTYIAALIMRLFPTRGRDWFMAQG